MPETYEVEIVRRDGLGQTGDDYHATITRQSDGVQLIAISSWRWWLRFRTRRGAIERAFKSYDKRLRKLAETESHIR